MVGTVSTMLALPQDRFLILGHRGASAHAPENTIEAFRLAAKQGAEGVELDVRRTADGELVVHHDAVINGVGPIVEHTRAELARLAPAVAGFPEAMAACAGLIVNIEIKNSPADPDFDAGESVAAQVVAWVAANDWADRVIVSSFNPVTVDRVRALSPGIATGQLLLPGVDAARELVFAHQRGHRAIHPHLSSLHEPEVLMRAAAELGMWVVAWTVDDEVAIRRFLQAGLTGIITNDPAAARAALA